MHLKHIVNKYLILLLTGLNLVKSLNGNLCNVYYEYTDHY